MRFSYFFWDPDPIAFRIPYLKHPITWYGILFATAFFIGFYLLRFLFKQFLKICTNGPHDLLKQKTLFFCEKIVVYVAISTLSGARLGHLFFYEQWREYLSHPLTIIKVWEGGLASHGGVIGALIGLSFFLFKNRREFPMLSHLRLIDLMVVPSLFVATWIRVGNFMNQEILGMPTKLPWSIIFGHPIDGSCPIPRHPAQLYEALFYFSSFLVYWKCFPKLIKSTGMLSGFFFLSIFSFRFLIEFLKEEQSALIQGGGLTMGQYLSIPLIAFGCFLLIKGFYKEPKESIGLKV